MKRSENWSRPILSIGFGRQTTTGIDTICPELCQNAVTAPPPVGYVVCSRLYYFHLLYCLYFQDFELLCRNGDRVSLDQYASGSCNLGIVSSHIVMASAATGEEIRELYKALLTQIDLDFGYNGEYNHIFKLYDSEAYGSRKNVMFSDTTKQLVDVAEVHDVRGSPRDTYYSWVGEYNRLYELDIQI